MHIKNLDLLAATAIAAMNVLWALLPSHPPVIGTVLALPLVFLLPGYTLTEALFPKRLISFTHRFIFSIILSLAIDIVSGFILNMFPTGIRAMSWAVSLGLLTVVFSLLVVYRRRGSSIEKIQLAKFRLGIYETILLGFSIVVTILAIQYSALKAAQSPHASFTQLWMLPSTNCAVRVGVHSFEATPVTYHMTLAVNGVQANTWPSVVLSPQAEWHRLVPIPSRSTNNVYVEVRLYKSDKPNIVYHEVHMTLNGLIGGSQNRNIQC